CPTHPPCSRHVDRCRTRPCIDLEPEGVKSSSKLPSRRFATEIKDMAQISISAKTTSCLCQKSAAEVGVKISQGCILPTSTTVVLMRLRVVCSANIWRSLGANGATWTRPEYAPRAAGSPARDARRDDESR